MGISETNADETHPDSDSRHTVGESVGSLVRAEACFARTDTTPPCSSEREPRPGYYNTLITAGSVGETHLSESCIHSLG